MPADRCPADVPESPADTATSALDVRGAFDTDRDGRGDTAVTVDGTDLLVHSDLDGDGIADRVLRIGADGSFVVEHPDGPSVPGAPWCGPVLDPAD